MGNYRAEAVISLPPEAVWEIMTDPSLRLLPTERSIEVTSVKNRIEQGSILNATIPFFGKDTDIEAVVTHAEPIRYLEIRGVKPTIIASMVLALTIQPHDTGLTVVESRLTTGVPKFLESSHNIATRLDQLMHNIGAMTLLSKNKQRSSNDKSRLRLTQS